MSQSTPLSKLLPQYNAVVESYQERMQHDNVKHLENMLNTYMYALQGGASSAALSHLERKMANRDNYNLYRTNKDALEWSMVDKKLHSYLGRNMGMLQGGGKDGEEVPASKEPQLVQSLKLLSAFINNLSEKMMTARSASLQELQEAVNILLKESTVSDRIKSALYLIAEVAAHNYQEDLERDAADLLMLEYLTLHSLATPTSDVILRSGIFRNLPPAANHRFMSHNHNHGSNSQAPSSSSSSHNGTSLTGGGGCAASTQYSTFTGGYDSASVQHPQHQQHQPRFRSQAAEKLYNIISQ
jgi:hypothetical protein